MNEEPPSNKNRDGIQHSGAIRLPRWSKHSIYARSGELVYVPHSPGSKPCFGFFYSSSLHTNDEGNY